MKSHPQSSADSRRRKKTLDTVASVENAVLETAVAENEIAPEESIIDTDPGQEKRTRGKRHPIRRALFIIVLFTIVGVLSVGVYAYSVTKNKIIDKEDQTGFFGQLHRIINNDVQPLAGEAGDRINVLLLGAGGEDHPGGGLTDTIMVASIEPSTNQVALISLPRDVVVPYYTDKTKNKATAEYRKLNYAYFLGGSELAIEKTEELTGLTMHYYVLIDFTGFRDIINTLGGLDVYVDNAFIDREYPDYNYGYQTISFTEGWQHMDGEDALQYARSRHGNNGEGSDFARAKRQQKILEGLQDKLLSASTLLNPAKITGLMDDLGNHVSTNMEMWEILRFASLAQSVNKETIINQVVDNGPGGVLHAESGEAGAYILVPNAGLADYSEIQAIAEHTFTIGEIAEEQALFAIQNGTATAGLASKTADRLKKIGDVKVFGNALVDTVNVTRVYNVSGEEFPTTTVALEELFETTVVTATIPSQPTSSVRLGTDVNAQVVDVAALPADVDFVVLIGADYAL